MSANAKFTDIKKKHLQAFLNDFTFTGLLVGVLISAIGFYAVSVLVKQNRTLSFETFQS